MRLSGENVLEILVGCSVNLLRALSWSNLAREKDCVLSDKVLDLVLHFLGDLDQHVLGLGWEVRMKLELRGVHHERLVIGRILQVLYRHTQTLLGHVSSLKDQVPGLLEPLSFCR